MKYRILWATLFFIALVGVYVYSQKKSVPYVSYTTIKNETYQFKDLKGQVVLVQFWVTSCSSCIEEMSQLIKLHQKFIHAPLKIVSISMNYDVPLFVINYSETNQLPFDIVIDKNAMLAKAFGEIEAVPTLFLVDKKGQIVKKLVGVSHTEELEQLITELL